MARSTRTICCRPGRKVHAGYLVNSIQEVYRLQGVNINDKHIETIVRQMMRWVKVEDVGDTTFLLEEQVDKFRFREENDRIIHDGGRPATGPSVAARHHQGVALDRFVHLGGELPGDHPRPHRSGHLRQGGLSPRPEGKRHHGPLIPAGTGLERYRNIKLLTEMPKEEPRMMEPELTPEEAAALDFLRKDTDAVAES